MAYYQIQIGGRTTFTASIDEERVLCAPSNGWREISAKASIMIVNGAPRKAVAIHWGLTVTTIARSGEEARKVADAYIPSLCYSDAAPSRLCGLGWRSQDVEFQVDRISALKTPGFRHNLQARWADLCASDDSWWPSNMGIDIAFEAMRSFVTPDWPVYGTGRGEDRLPSPYSHSPREREGIPGFWQHKMHPIMSLTDLRNRFAHMMLANGKADWKARRNVGLDQSILVKRPVYRKPLTGQLRDRLRIMLEQSANLVITPQLNTVHAKARNIYGVGIVIGPKGFLFTCSYGYEGSYWTTCLAESFPGEPFVDTMERAWRVFSTYLVPDYAQQIEAARKVQWEQERARLAA